MDIYYPNIVTTLKHFEEEYIQAPKTSNSNHFVNFEQTLNTLLPETPEQTKLARARQILGENLEAISDEQLETFIAQIEYLMNSWMDSYEKELFDGKTLREIAKTNTP